MARYLTAEEIAEALRSDGDAHVSARTVHYYAEQRLLPPPEYDGARPRYTSVHLEAMRRARALKRRGHKLGEVGSLIAPPAPAQIAPPASGGVPPLSPAEVREGRTEAPSHTQRTIAVGPGLTLSASGWGDDDLARIVAAIRGELEALGRA